MIFDAKVLTNDAGKIIGCYWHNKIKNEFSVRWFRDRNTDFYGIQEIETICLTEKEAVDWLFEKEKIGKINLLNKVENVKV